MGQAFETGEWCSQLGEDPRLPVLPLRLVAQLCLVSCAFVLEVNPLSLYLI